MAKALYFLVTFLESGLAVFGIRGIFEQPHYHVVRPLGDAVEIRSYPALVAVQTTNDAGGFGRLFQYIAGANHDDETIKMTAPVVQTGGSFAPGESDGQGVIEFVLPTDIAKHPPAPNDGAVHIVDLPPQQLAVIRFSGLLTKASVADARKTLLHVLAENKITPRGSPLVLGYDPPFTIPFLRRNEVAVSLGANGAGAAGL